ncbi:type IV pilus assembly protein PilX [Pseudomonas duriflava]|uniref:Type IV pilus assembly protein PilX n=1 Tax=Pseudomonas duriflava TaxID=459528 RepID=A0A562QDN3_9PSED|nr:PilX N-terminal domain-containing pilus assembly protein [Pseudomonas duriflava]TWI54862.1 type IV pilus assembly protein PilX [Pseudomonas duriflava]
MNASPKRQQGATLLIALIMLLLITLIATSSMRITTQQTHVSGNLAERTRAFNAAESALREGERRLLNLSDTLFSSSSSGYSSCPVSVAAIGSNVCILTEAYDLSTTELALTWAGTALDASGTASQSVAYSGYDGTSSFSVAPRWVITPVATTSKNTTDVTQITEGKGVYYYRITAAAKDSGKRIPVILQSIVKVEK